MRRLQKAATLSMFFLYLLSSVCMADDKSGLCGSYSADEGYYETFVFGDENTVEFSSMGLEFQSTYFIKDDSLFVKHDKGFFEFKINPDGSFTGVDIWTEGILYTKNGEAENECTGYNDDPSLSCLVEAEFYRSKGELENAKSSYLNCCEMGNLESCNAYGNIIYLLEQDEATAMKYYNLACEKGLGAACYNIADFAIENGDLAKAKEMYKKACDLDYRAACMELGSME
jgi:tetratricopeptide (TPR) repeat protein